MKYFDHSDSSTVAVLGTRIDGTSYEAATEQVVDWAATRDSRYVCVANVHMVMVAFDNPPYRALINRADLVTPDGIPLVWMLRALGMKDQQRVYGPTLTLHICEAAAGMSIPIGFYGGRPAVLDAMIQRLAARFPGLVVAYAYSPPFRPPTAGEDKAAIDAINRSGARILFVGLGCPKQEIWMAERQGKIEAVMLGVGAAFDIHAGVVRQAPPWLQRMGFEWLFRLVMEPRRLWRRYLKHNPRFIVLATGQLLRLTGQKR